MHRGTHYSRSRDGCLGWWLPVGTPGAKEQLAIQVLEMSVIVADRMVASESHWFDGIYQAPGICQVKLFPKSWRYSGDQARPGPCPQAACSPGQEILTQWQVGKVPLGQEGGYGKTESACLVQRGCLCPAAMRLRVPKFWLLKKSQIFTSNLVFKCHQRIQSFEMSCCTKSTPRSHHSSFFKSSLIKV